MKLKPITHFKKYYLRFGIFIACLSVIGAFLTQRPKEAAQLLSTFVGHFIDQTDQVPQLDLISPLNEYRVQKSLPPLETNDKLNQIAHLIALSLADNPENENINLEQLATAADYPYQIIAYFAAINPLPLITTPTTAWISSQTTELENTQFTQIGSNQLNATFDDQPQLITVVVLAAQSTKATQNYTSTKPSPQYYTGTELWTQIQKYRIEHGVPQFVQDNLLCTLASIRVNQLLELGKLDNHEGFKPLVEKYRQDGSLKFSNVSENILSGYQTASEAIAAWDGSLGHQSLLQSGAHVWACAASNHGFSVLIAAY